MLLFTGLMGLSSLCVLFKALSSGVTGFICSKYFCLFCLLLCYICVKFVGFVFEMILSDLNELLYKILLEYAKYWNVV